jgi:hypothetical protein
MVIAQPGRRWADARCEEENEIEREARRDRLPLVEPEAGASGCDTFKNRQHDQHLRQPAAVPKRVAL